MMKNIVKMLRNEFGCNMITKQKHKDLKLFVYICIAVGDPTIKGGGGFDIYVFITITGLIPLLVHY